MKKYMRVCLLALALLALMALPAFAGYSDVLDKATNAVVTIDSVNTDKLSTVQYTEAQDDGLYLLLVLDGNNTLVPTEENILYVEQAQADGTTVTFNNDGKGVYPSSAKKSTVCLAGPGLASPIKLADLDVSGYAVNGTVKGYNGNNKPEVKLYAATDTGHTSPLFTATVGAAAASDAQFTWDFDFSAVGDGTYDLVVSKAGHLDYTITGVVVNGGNLDLTASSNTYVSEIVMLAGDVNSDGSITESDVTIIRYTTNINKPTASAADALADVNGDGSVTESDVTIVRYTVHINKNTGHCKHTF